MKIERRIEGPPPVHQFSADRVARFQEIFYQIRGRRIGTQTAQRMLANEAAVRAEERRDRPLRDGLRNSKKLGHHRHPGEN